MSMPSLENSPACDKLTGLARFAISAGTKERVDRLTEQLRSDGSISFSVSEASPQTF